MIRFLFLNDSEHRVAGILEEKADGILRGLKVALTDQMRLLSNYVKTDKLSGQVINRRSGNLSRNVNAKVEEDSSGVTGYVGVGRPAPYGRILELGGTTRPHDILPVEAKALRFEIGGQVVFRRVVHHPGSKFPPRPYLRTALEEKRFEIIEGLVEGIREATA